MLDEYERDSDVAIEGEEPAEIAPEDSADILSKLMRVDDREIYGAEASLAIENREGHYLAIEPDKLYPGLQNVEKMRMVWADFMHGTSLEEVAAIHDVNERTVFKWAAHGKWVERRQDVEDARIAEQHQNLERLRSNKRFAAVENQVELGDRMHEIIKEASERDGLRPADIKNLAESHKAVSDTTFKALGFNESGGVNGVKSKTEEKAQVPLVVVIKGGGLPDMKPNVTIDI